MIRRIFYFVFIISFGFKAQSQALYNDYGFEKHLQVPVKDINDNFLNKAWSGGLNSCQFGAIDLNQDGIKDLIVFDRNGNRVLTFINNAIPNTISYSYEPEYIQKLPYIHDWVEFVDYNCDGKTDIFTYSNGGIAVYINESSMLNGLKFKLKTSLLKSQQGSYYTNIFVTSVDYPALSDIDNDGDIDILTFFGLGSYVEYHKNLSKELYGNCDSLKYQLFEYCWGLFSENEGSNRLTLNITCPYNTENILINQIEKLKEKHTGSTLLAIDLDGDSDKDLLLGDVDFPNLISLTNGGNANNAIMISQDTIFPLNTSPVHLFTFPSASYIDVNNDNKNDLLVSPFDGNIVVAENKKSVWLYTNSGTNTSPVFNYQIPDFLQGEMIDVGTCAYPVLYDYDGDGMKDLFVGNYGYRDTSFYTNGYLITRYRSKIALFKNTGTNTIPQFKLNTTDFVNVSALNLLGVYPTFGDIDNDGKAEMILGNGDGKLLLFKNTANIGNPPNFVLQQLNYQNIDVGDYSTPQLIDLNRDNLIDLVVGEKGYQKGNLNYYKNTGTLSTPVFTLATDSLGGVDVCDHSTSNYGYSVPCFFEDTIGKYKLFVGSEQGYIHYYKNIENNLNSTFKEEDPHLLYIYEGFRTGVATGDLNNDGYLDMIIGNYSGGLCYYKGSEPLPQSDISIFNKPNDIDIQIFPNPASKILNLNIKKELDYNKIDFFIYSSLGKIVLKNTLFKNDLKIDIANLPNGIYIICISITDNSSKKAYLVNKKFSIIH